jgi:pyrophosphatase PpaX
MNEIKLVVFDLDGTLTNSGNTIYKATLKTLKQLGINDEIKFDDFNKTIGAHFTDMFKSLNVNVEDVEHFINLYKTYYFDFIDDTYLYDGVIETLKELKKRNIKTALLTTKAQDQADLVIDYFKLREYFGLVTGRRPGLGIKPDASPLIFICNELNVKPENTLMAGDSELDIKCGKNASTVTCAVTYGFRAKEHLENEKPDYIINDIRELLNLV